MYTRRPPLHEVPLTVPCPSCDRTVRTPGTWAGDGTELQERDCPVCSAPVAIGRDTRKVVAP